MFFVFCFLFFVFCFFGPREECVDCLGRSIPCENSLVTHNALQDNLTIKAAVSQEPEGAKSRL